MGGSASAPPPPDTSRFSDEAMDQSKQMRGWAEDMWNSGQQEWSKLQAWGQEVMGMAMPAMEDSFSWASDQRDRFNEYVVPQMQSLFSDAETYASKAEEDRQRGAAIQDVKAATEAQRESQLRKLESYGVEPDTLRYAALDKQAGVAEAALSALAANQAGERTKQIGRDLRSEAIDVGNTFLRDATASSQVGSQIGAQGLNAATNATGAGSQVAQSALPYMSGAMSGVDLGAGIVDTAYGRELDYAEDQRAADAADMAAMSGLAGGAMNMAGNYMTGGGLNVLTGGMNPYKAASGGAISAPGGPTSDMGAIAISDGEYVVPADVVRKLGTNHFDKMIEKETGRPPPGQKQAIPIPQTKGGAF